MRSHRQAQVPVRLRAQQSLEDQDQDLHILIHRKTRNGAIVHRLKRKNTNVAPNHTPVIIDHLVQPNIGAANALSTVRRLND